MERKEKMSFVRYAYTYKLFKTATWEFEQKNIILLIESHQEPLWK